MNNENRAKRVITFIESLKHTKGEFYGKPFILLKWEREFINDVFGTIKPNGARRYNTAYVEIPKKNGKSELGAAIALYLLCADGEMSAEVYSCAADRGQASIVFDVACKMVEQSPELRKRIKIIQSTKRMIYYETSSFYQVLSAEAYTKHGLNVSAVIFDELHAQPNRELYDVMTKGSGDARRQPLNIILTTAGDNTNSIGYEVHQKAAGILSGKLKDDTFYSLIFGLKEGQDWKDEKVWRMCNPSIDKTISIDKVRAQFNAINSPRDEVIFKQLRLNEWVSSSINWLNAGVWENNNYKFDIESLKGRTAFGGLDLSSTTDITAFVLVFPPLREKDGPNDDDIDCKYIVLPFFWIPEDNIAERVRRDHVPYDDWLRLKYINATEGNVLYYGFIEKQIDELGKIYNIKEIAFDRWGATEMVQKLEEFGFVVYPFGQGFRDMSPATKELERLAISRSLAHAGNVPLSWMVSNVKIRKDPAGNVKPDKEKSTEKIDGVIATIMALSRAVSDKQDQLAYQDRDLLIL